MHAQIGSNIFVVCGTQFKEPFEHAIKHWLKHAWGACVCVCVALKEPFKHALKHSFRHRRGVWHSKNRLNMDFSNDLNIFGM